MKIKAFLSIVLCIILAFGSFSVAGYAANAVSENLLTADTEIVKGERYCISTVKELEALAKIVNEDKNRCEGAIFYLGNDITVNDGTFSVSDGEVFYNDVPVEQAESLAAIESIGTGLGFAGTFDGNGYTISGLYLNGLFNKCSSARISNLKIINSYVTSGGILGSSFSSSCRINNCYVEGIVCSDAREVGLFAGSLAGAIIRDCHAKGYVKGNANVGGFAGRMLNCEADNVLCDVQVEANSTVGGFAGIISGDNTVLEKCAVVGSVDCKDEKAGQFASSIELYCFDDGYNVTKTLNICYAAVKTNYKAEFCNSFTGDTEGVNQCYYMSEEQDENGFETFTEAQMKTTDFVDVLNKEPIEKCNDKNVEWGYYGIYYVGIDGEFPIPYGVHYSAVGVSGHDFSAWELYNSTGESRTCTYHACEKKEQRSHYHTWGEYVDNADASENTDGTKTAHCTKEGCTATDTVTDYDNLRMNRTFVKSDLVLQKGWLYMISNLEEWKIFIELCKQDTTGIEFAIVEDIDADSRYDMEPIEKFSGILDGQNHSLICFANKREKCNLAGIFASCDGAEFKNLTVLGCVLSDASASGEATGGLCAKAVNTKFTNCTIKSMINGTNESMGGLVGYAENCEIVGCRNLTLVSGIAKYTGGLVGQAKNCTISECYNSGTVNGVNVGGLVGKLENCKVSYCYNIGLVSGDIYTGGFAGMIYPTKEDNTIKCCYAAGELIGENVGSFCGYYSIDNIFALSMCSFVGNDISQADSSGAIDYAYKKYVESLRDDDINYEIWTGKSLGIDAVVKENLKKINNSYYAKYFVGGAGESNDGLMQLRRFHTEHVWGEYKLKDNQMVAECLCDGCRYTDTKAHVHKYENYVLNEDKLTETGTCICGATGTRPHSHVFDPYIYNNDADCVTNGTMTAVCQTKGCGATDTEPDPRHYATGHKFVDYVLSEDGLTETAHCQNKGCNETNTVEHKHAWGEYIYNNDADCETNGTMTANCSRVGCKVTDTLADPEHKATGHSFGEYVLDKNGSTETAHCQNEGCNKTDTVEHKHTWGAYIYNGDVTCEKDGTMTRHCTKSGCTATDTITDPNNKATGHVWGNYTLDEDGLTETARCYNRGCNKTNTIEHKHLWGGYSYNGDVTCEENGTKTAHCVTAGCKATDTQTDYWHKATGHNFGEYIYNNDADCENDGTKTRHCMNAGCEKTETVVDSEHKATGHSFGKWKSNGDAKLFANGTESRACHCGLTETRVAERSAKIVVFFDKVYAFVVSLFK